MSVLLLAGLLGPAPAPLAQDSAELFASDNMTHVANLPYDRAFPDALVVGAAVAATGGVLYLIDGLGLAGSPETLTALEAAGLQRLRIVGGPAAVSEDVGAQLEALLPTDAAGPREYAVAGTEFNGMQLVDITDPEAATITSVYDCGALQGDVQVFTQGERTLATFTSEDTTALIVESRCVQDAVAAGDITFVDDSKAPAYGTYVVDITDPLAPRYGGFIPVIEGSHKRYRAPQRRLLLQLRLRADHRRHAPDPGL